MSKKTAIAVLIIAMSAICASAFAATLTVDDIPNGSQVAYYQGQHGVLFEPYWTIVSHDSNSWWSAHSGSKALVVTCDHAISSVALIVKSEQVAGFSSVGGYFSTKQGVVIKMTAYAVDKDHPVATAEIGASGAAWNNQFAQVSSDAGDITMVELTPVSGSDALLNFCADDFTIEPASAQ